MGMGGHKLKPNSFSSLKLKTAHSVSLASFRFLKLDNMSCQMNHTLYIVLNFEVLKPYSEKKFWQEKIAYTGSNLWIVFTSSSQDVLVVLTWHWDVLNLPSNRSSPLWLRSQKTRSPPPPFYPFLSLLLPGTTSEMDSCHRVSCIRMMSTGERINYRHTLEWEACKYQALQQCIALCLWNR